MNIAVNTRFLTSDEMEGYGNFVHELCKLLPLKHPEHQFFYLFDREFSKECNFPLNVHPVVIRPAARHPLLWKYWFDIKVPLVLKRIKADLFISPDGYCSLSTNVPQYLVMHDLGFLHQPEAYQPSHVNYYKRFTPRFLKKANQIAVVSEFTKTDILKHYSLDPQKINVVYNGVKEVFQPVPFDIQLKVKEKYTAGKEYFICVGAIQPRKNLINLLKAFSIFKKRMKSGMKLVLVGRLAWKNNEFLQLLKTYKYREDVILTGYVEELELAGLTGSAYAAVYPSLFEGFGVPVLEAMRSDVAVLTSINSSMMEIGEDGCLYFDPKHYEDIAEKMMMIYKDEELRKRLIEKGKIISSKYSWERTEELFWNGINW
ncbi:MAG: glycosyltransferase family 4 protein [Flavisolibacter sp.]